jgi:hypothetical protein
VIRRVIAGFMVLVMLATYVVPADAKIAVVISFGYPGADEYSDSTPTFFRDLIASVRGSLDALGVDYDVVPQSLGATKTHYLRTGQIVYNAGTPTAYVKSYDAVVHVLTALVSKNTYRPDSVLYMMSRLSDTSLTSVRYNTVPQLFLMCNGSVNISVDSVAGSLDTDRTDTSQLGQVVWSPGNPYPYRPGVGKFSVMSSTLSSVPGNWRVLLRAGQGIGKWAHSGSIPSPRPDSLNRYDGATINSDTAIVYARTLSSIPAAKPIIIINHSDFQSVNTDMTPLFAALAYADSSMGGAILGTAKNIPMKVGIQIRGGFSRGAQLGIPTSTGGMTIEDSTAFKASIDSLASLNVPMVLGVNVDSISTYTNYDGRWWSNVPMLKYGVYQRAGLDSTAASGAASFDNPRDIFGMWRNRAAFGDSTIHSIQTVDTSLAQLVRGAFSKLATAFGAGKVDRIMMAQGDDWCPKNGLSMGQDSLVYGLSKGGAKGVVVNPFRERPGVNTQGQGLHQRPGNDPIVYNRSRGPFKFLATPSYLDSGSVRFDNGNQGRYPTLVQTERMFRTMVNTFPAGSYNQANPTNTQGVSWSSDSTVNVRARILTIHASDLQSGLRNDASTIPLRPGWWVVKNFVNQIKTINSFAYRGKPLFVIAYPEDCEP